MRVYFFGWPGAVGGASTKLAHLILLLRHEFELVVVPFFESEQADQRWRDWMEGLGVRCLPFAALPPKLEGWGVLLCHFPAIESDLVLEIRRRGLRVAWSNEMMWARPAELGAVGFGLFDAVLYVSNVQRAALEPSYRGILTGLPPDETPALNFNALEGQLAPGIRWVMTGNYIAPEAFPFRDRSGKAGRSLVVGRLSRPDPGKYPDDFPAHYEGLGLRKARFRVMGWGGKLMERWPRERFGEHWELLPPMAELPAAFLQSLDLFVYDLGAKCCESWGRAVVEAMLTGAVPLVPADRRHHLHALVPHGEAGFHCRTQEEFGHYARLLERDDQLRHRMSRRAREWAETRLCNAEEHLTQWRRVFHGGAG